MAWNMGDLGGDPVAPEESSITAIEPIGDSPPSEHALSCWHTHDFAPPPLVVHTLVNDSP